MDYSTKKISIPLVEEIKSALQSIGYGSIEIYVSDNKVTQITTRSIKKTSIEVKPNSSSKKTSAGKKQTTSNGRNKKNGYSQNILNIHNSLPDQR